MTATLISPSHVFHGEYLILGFLAWVSIINEGHQKPTYARTLKMMQVSNESFE